MIILFFLYYLNSFPYSKLLSDSKGEYSLYFMWGEEIGSNVNGFKEWPQAFNNSSITKIHVSDDLTFTNKKYPKLKIEKRPVVIIFNHKNPIFKTYDISEAEKFIEEELSK